MMEDKQKNELGSISQSARDIYTRLNMSFESGQDRRKQQIELVGRERRLDADWRFATIRRSYQAQ